MSTHIFELHDFWLLGVAGEIDAADDKLGELRLEVAELISGEAGVLFGDGPEEGVKVRLRDLADRIQTLRPRLREVESTAVTYDAARDVHTAVLSTIRYCEELDALEPAEYDDPLEQWEDDDVPGQ